MTATYTQNRLPNTARHDTTPYQLLWKNKPSLGHMRVFGTRGYVFVDSSKRKEVDAKAFSRGTLKDLKPIVFGTVTHKCWLCLEQLPQMNAHRPRTFR